MEKEIKHIIKIEMNYVQNLEREYPNNNYPGGFSSYYADELDCYDLDGLPRLKHLKILNIHYVSLSNVY